MATLTDPSVVTKILDHLGLPSEPPQLSPARHPAWQLDLFEDAAWDAPPTSPGTTDDAVARGPPPSAPPADWVVELDELPDESVDWDM